MAVLCVDCSRLHSGQRKNDTTKDLLRRGCGRTFQRVGEKVGGVRATKDLLRRGCGRTCQRVGEKVGGERATGQRTVACTEMM